MQPVLLLPLSLIACAGGPDSDAPDPATERGDDCDDADPRTHPGATEQCDGAHRDCDGDPYTPGACAAPPDRALVAWAPCRGARDLASPHATSPPSPPLERA